MKISIVCIGKIKEKYFVSAIEEYTKRLSKYIKLEIVELQDEKAPEKLSKADEEIVKLKEAEKIMKVIKNARDEFIVSLCIDGNSLDSIQLSQFFQENMNKGISHITFIIGGSLGLHKSIIDISNYKLSFSKMTFPHQLMRVILVEQIYRTQRIIKNEPYHK